MPATAVRERPILFSAPMIRALLTNQKAQTRRVVQPQPPQQVESVKVVEYSSDQNRIGRWSTQSHPEWIVTCPYGRPGDRLWVRETWRLNSEDYSPRTSIQGAFARDNVHYRADEDWNVDAGWRPSIFMPRWASRLTLEISDIRVQRLDDISEDDAAAEGVEPEVDEAWEDDPDCPPSHRVGFRELWDRLNGPRGFGWDINPWVWAITFRKCT
jgi:hypothetical protein